MKQGDARVLPVLLPAAGRLTRTALRERLAGPALRLRASHGIALFAAFVLACGIAQAQTAAGNPSIF